MPTTIEYALMAGRAYYATRLEINRFPAPPGWTELPQSPKPSGFEAVTFQRGTGSNAEIVIAYAGTDPSDISGDVAADAGLISGIGSTQLQQAAEFYLKTKASNQRGQSHLTF